jgi:hypothetical protein
VVFARTDDFTAKIAKVAKIGPETNLLTFLGDLCGLRGENPD